ncbi:MULTISPECIES: FadR/GntR family transcriptional regulator [unclassified Devosia]|uniref:FadR/GntR family transcriptional regulator n=1 Tax=unclassified Devosia TaxID=196773 RepID=UPI0020BE5B8A|nr:MULTISPECIES: FadR/GntR family transcriptional regulator [unclassified Devosia]
MDRIDGANYQLSNKRLYQVVAQRIAQMIEAHSGDPSWRLPSERELAEELQVSRPSIREAVIALEMRGVVEVRGRAGIVILPRKTNDVNFDIINTDIGPGPFELLQARLAVESGAAAIAAQRANSYDIMRLEDSIARMQDEGSSAVHNEKNDREFHMIIAHMTGNAIVVSITEALWAQRDASRMWKKIHEHMHGDAVRPTWIGDHHAIVAALKLRNADAAYKAMARHINNVSEELLQADERRRLTGPED